MRSSQIACLVSTAWRGGWWPPGSPSFANWPSGLFKSIFCGWHGDGERGGMAAVWDECITGQEYIWRGGKVVRRCLVGQLNCWFPNRAHFDWRLLVMVSLIRESSWINTTKGVCDTKRSAPQRPRLSPPRCSSPTIYTLQSRQNMSSSPQPCHLHPILLDLFALLIIHNDAERLVIVIVGQKLRLLCVGRQSAI